MGSTLLDIQPTQVWRHGTPPVPKLNPFGKLQSRLGHPLQKPPQPPQKYFTIASQRLAASPASPYLDARLYQPFVLFYLLFCFSMQGHRQNNASCKPSCRKCLNANFASWSLGAVGNNATTCSAEGHADMNVLDQATFPVASSCGPYLVDHSTLEEAHYRVSPCYLTLASLRFEGMLLGEHWKEGVRNEVSSLHHVTAEDYAIETLLVLLKVLHHRNHQVPRTISLNLLTKLAVLNYYYECAEALGCISVQVAIRLSAVQPLYGALIKEMKIQGSSPPPTIPLFEWSIFKLYIKLHCIRFSSRLSACRVVRGWWGRHRYLLHLWLG
jgi:hypothetical protein